jgi:DNA-binding transcriptional LysR family regulator
MDIDLRKLRYFVAVAEELHFGQAADRLHIAQPVLSRQIRAFEDELGMPLFRRDRSGTALTPAGRQLLDDARPLLVSAQALRRRVAGAAAAGTMFTIGFMPGITVTPAVRAMQARHPVLEVRLPVDVRGLETRRLFDEPRVALLPSGHRLAGKETVMIRRSRRRPAPARPRRGTGVARRGRRGARANPAPRAEDLQRRGETRTRRRRGWHRGDPAIHGAVLYAAGRCDGSGRRPQPWAQSQCRRGES